MWNICRQSVYFQIDEVDALGKVEKVPICPLVGTNKFFKFFLTEIKFFSKYCAKISKITHSHYLFHFLKLTQPKLLTLNKKEKVEIVLSIVLRQMATCWCYMTTSDLRCFNMKSQTMAMTIIWGRRASLHLNPSLPSQGRCSWMQPPLRTGSIPSKNYRNQIWEVGPF